MNDNREILAFLQEILARLEKIKQQLKSPKAANVNRLAPKLRLITDEDE